jgi:outer membrane protein TolC
MNDFRLLISGFRFQMEQRLVLCLMVLSASVIPGTGTAQVTTISAGAPVVTLPEARQRALRVDPVAVEATSNIRTAEWTRRSAMADLIAPRLTGNVNYIRFSDPFFNFGTGAITPNAASASLEASWTILGAGKFGIVKATKAGLESAEATELATRFQSALRTDEAYFAVLAQKELRSVAEDRLERATEQLAVARVRVVAGEAIASDSLQLLLEVNRSRYLVLIRDSALVASHLQLGTRIGLAGPADAAPVDTLPPRPLPFTEIQATTELRERGPDIEAARAEERSAQARVTAAKERYLPALTLTGTTGAYDDRLFPDALKRSQLAVGLSLPFWDGGQREVVLARANAERDVARAVRDERERSASERIAQAYLGYETARAGIGLAQVGVAAASETFRVQRARYGEGATTILDLLEAQVALSEAEAALVQSRFAARLALSQIEALLGRRVFGEPATGTNR